MDPIVFRMWIVFPISCVLLGICLGAIQWAPGGRRKGIAATLGAASGAMAFFSGWWLFLYG